MRCIFHAAVHSLLETKIESLKSKLHSILKAVWKAFDSHFHLQRDTCESELRVSASGQDCHFEKMVF